ncbi:GH116 family glycosyl hydrolase [Tropicimonas sp. TH_r6]|uniref:GH116 family glycosyl hydrolase n=1 Tax=Tropicimonas sp. TH_r6 TaxID=3082085 RepID=UPI0029532217|nr:GH116 family glycosyl hydrolase [Tropicimonas sp. TH_r6]MDV7142146.1 GH116 family glycosyl hydrolase [Tropicimonas sp. TH_r6]
MKKDLFCPPNAAAIRPAGHRLRASQGKLDCLFQPLEATGVPLGGIGTGTITRASDGRFSRWTLKGGGIADFTMPANGFLLRVKPEGAAAQARALQPAPDRKEMSSFQFETEAPDWGGLFPLAWHRHAPLAGIETTCRSFSPVIPGDLQSASLPVSIFRWRLTNRGDTPAEVSLAFTFANLNGWFDSFSETRPARVAAGCYNHGMELSGGTGLFLDRRQVAAEPPEGSGQWAISIAAGEAAQYSRTICFDATGDGSELWSAFHETGDAPDFGDGWVSESGFRETAPGHPAGAVCARLDLAPGESRELTVTLAWDLPTLSFGQGRRWFRRYTGDWDCSGRNATALTEHAHRHAADWSARIADWHESIRNRLGDAPHQAGLAINECYFLTGGLSVATSAQGSPDGRPRFGIIECHDYALYNTMDMWVYAAEAVSRFFPELAAGVAQDYAEFLLQEDRNQRRHRWDKSLFPLNPAGTCPHDVGGPGEDPFVVPNSYSYRDSTIWKDLNCDLVLCLYREGRQMPVDWRRARFPAVKAALDHLQRYDRDGDGLIENDGIPDQTFDNIPMTGPSSYCGGLWIAALLAGAALATEIGEASLARSWREQAEAAKQAFNARLFNGAWFRVDTDGPFSEACFIEQLFGPFLAKRLGLGDIVPQDHAQSALSEIFARNFLKAGGGEGAVSITGLTEAARAALPHQDDTSFQTSEIQPGFNFSLAAQLDLWGMGAEADQLRAALCHQLHERNLSFQTPAAFDRGTRNCRAILNMRPMAAAWAFGEGV